jgi:hypothetical protein
MLNARPLQVGLVLLQLRDDFLAVHLDNAARSGGVLERRGLNSETPHAGTGFAPKFATSIGLPGTMNT